MILKKHHLLFIMIVIIIPSSATSDDSLDFIRSYLTQSYHKLLHSIDDKVKCEKSCKILEKNNIEHNNLQLITSFKTSQNNHIQFSLNLRGHIYLPKISKKLELTFSKESNEYIHNKQTEYENENLVTDENVRVGLRYYFSRDEEYRFYTKLGFKIHSPFGFYQALSIEKDFSYAYNIHSNSNITLYYFFYHSYFAKSGQLVFYKPINFSFLLEQRNKIYTNHDNHHNTHIKNDIKLYYTYNKNNILTYRITYATADKTNKHFYKDWQGMSLGYIHYLKKWFYINTIPHLVQRRENHFKTEFALTVNIGLKLGL